MFIGNRANITGGDVYAADNSTILIEGARLVNGSSGWKGGSAATQDHSNVTLINSSVVGARTSNDPAAGRQEGGCIHASGNTTTSLLRSSLVGCSTHGDGGGLYLMDDATLVVNGSNISNNTAEGDGSLGGGVCATKSSVISISETRFVGNEAGFGAVFMLNQNASLVVHSKVHFVENVAAKAGGGVRFHSAGFKVQDVPLLEFKNSEVQQIKQWPQPPWSDLSVVLRAVEVVDRSNVDRFLHRNATGPAC